MKKPDLKHIFLSRLLIRQVGLAVDVPTDNFFLPTNRVVDIRISPSDVLVFDSRSNDNYVLNKRDLNIVAKQVRVDGNVAIKSFDDAAPS